MNSFFKGICSLFSWMECYGNLSPKERVDQILEDFYFDHPEIERDDLRALQKDSETIASDFYAR